MTCVCQRLIPLRRLFITPMRMHVDVRIKENVMLLYMWIEKDLLCGWMVELMHNAHPPKVLLIEV